MTIAVAVAGFLTTVAGTPGSNGTFMSYRESLLIVGIVTAVGIRSRCSIHYSPANKGAAADTASRSCQENPGHLHCQSSKDRRAALLTTSRPTFDSGDGECLR